MATPTKAVYNAGDQRPASSSNVKTKAIYNASDYRPGFGFGAPSAKSKGGKAKKATKAKIWSYSHRLAPGANRDPWGGHH